MSERCSANVHDGGRSVNFHQCTRRAVIVRKERAYCKQHDPVEVKKRDTARLAKWDAEWKRKEKIWAWEAAYDKLFPKMLTLLEEVLALPFIEPRWRVRVERTVRAAKKVL